MKRQIYKVEFLGNVSLFAAYNKEQATETARRNVCEGVWARERISVLATGT